MNFYEIIKTKKLGRGFPDYWTQLFAEHVGGKGEWKVSGVLPLTFTAKGVTAVDWVIEGNDDVGENLIPLITEANGWRTGYRDKTTGNYGSGQYMGEFLSPRISVDGSETVTVKADNMNPSQARYTSGTVYFFDSSDNYIGYANFTDYSGTVITVQSGAASFDFAIRTGYTGFPAVEASDFWVELVRGSTAPDHYIPYQQGVGERTQNLVEGKIANTNINAGGQIISNPGYNTWVAPVKQGVTYTFTTDGAVYAEYTEYPVLGSIAYNHTRVVTTTTFTATIDGYIVFRTSTNYATAMCVVGSTAPTTYIPHGYQVPITVSQRPIYPIQWELKGKAVRDQVTSTKGNEILTWDVIGIDHDECYYADGRRAAHSVTLQLHDCFASLQFDEREALFYAESTMPAGTYHFTVREQPWYASDVGKTFQFTLTQTLAAGSQICVTNTYNAAMTSAKIKTYSGSTSTTAIETVDVTEGNSGTDLGDVRNALVGQNTNSIQRALLGSNNWANSAMRQWLNSSAVAGSVWTPKTKLDRPPSWVSSIAGFLNGMDEDFVKAVGTVKKTIALNTVTDGGGKVESDERFFLLSRSEVYGGNEVAGGKGAAYSYYADYSDLSGAGIGADTNRIKYRNGAAQYWWLRSPNAPSASHMHYVYTAGNVNSGIANNSFGVAPAICIPMDEVYDCNEVDIYIGDTPLTEGETVSKTSTGVDIELFEGENTVSTTLYNKPAMKIKYK